MGCQMAGPSATLAAPVPIERRVRSPSGRVRRRAPAIQSAVGGGLRPPPSQRRAGRCAPSRGPRAVGGAIRCIRGLFSLITERIVTTSAMRRCVAERRAASATRSGLPLAEQREPVAPSTIRAGAAARPSRSATSRRRSSQRGRAAACSRHDDGHLPPLRMRLRATTTASPSPGTSCTTRSTASSSTFSPPEMMTLSRAAEHGHAPVASTRSPRSPVRYHRAPSASWKAAAVRSGSPR